MMGAWKLGILWVAGRTDMIKMKPQNAGLCCFITLSGRRQIIGRKWLISVISIKSFLKKHSERVIITLPSTNHG